jgi:hypothetical protein
MIITTATTEDIEIEIVLTEVTVVILTGEITTAGILTGVTTEILIGVTVGGMAEMMIGM